MMQNSFSSPCSSLHTPLHRQTTIDDVLQDNNDNLVRSRPFLEVPTDMESNHENYARNNKRTNSYSTPARKVLIPILGGTLVCLLFLGAFWNQETDGKIYENNRHQQYPSFMTPEEYSASFGNIVQDGEACYTALDCGAGRWCAFPSMHNMSIRICCDEALHLGLEDDADGAWLTVCTGAAVGEPCGSHHQLCASGTCVHGKCAAQGLNTAARCPDHGACASAACGRYTYNTTLSQRCCPTAQYVTVQTSDLPYPISLCAGTAAVGEPCGDQTAVCQDGLQCHDNGTCQPM